jgi:hypothetical protein
MLKTYWIIGKHDLKILLLACPTLATRTTNS